MSLDGGSGDWAPVVRRTRRISLRAALSNRAKGASADPRLAMNMVSQPGFASAWRTTSRNRRFTRFLTTALPTLFPAMKQNRLRSNPLGRTRMTNRLSATLRPRRWTSEIRLPLANR